MKFFSFIIVLILSLFVIFSCEVSEKECVDAQLLEMHKDTTCLGICPGVCGCDNKTYCSTCEALKRGVKVVAEKPCNQI